MSVQIHIVMGTTGEYNDRSQWAVCAYQDKARADEHADLAKIEAHKIEKQDQTVTQVLMMPVTSTILTCIWTTQVYRLLCYFCRPV